MAKSNKKQEELRGEETLEETEEGENSNILRKNSGTLNITEG